MIKSATIKGKRFKIKDVFASDGYCTDPNHGGRTLAIPVGGDTLGELTVIVHEMLHAAFWDVDENIIDQVGYDMARTLWNLNWRKEDE